MNWVQWVLLYFAIGIVSFSAGFLSMVIFWTRYYRRFYRHNGYGDLQYERNIAQELRDELKKLKESV